MGSLPPTEFESFLVNDYCSVSTAVLLLYDLMLTTRDEMRLFWGRKFTGATILFMINKWLCILLYGSILATFLKTSDATCGGMLKLQLIIEVLLSLVWGAFTALRIYALHANWLLASIALFLSTVSAGVNLTQFASGILGKDLPLLHCVEMNSKPVPLSLAKTFTIASRTSLILGNCLAIGVTWFTMGKSRRALAGTSWSGTIASVLLWDGFIYFLVLAIIDALHMTITLLSINQLIVGASSDLTIFSFPLTAIIVSRFILHLQSANLRATGTAASQGQTTSHDGSLVFERVVGSLAASISPDDYFKTEGDHDYADTLDESVTEVDGGVDLQGA